MTNSQKTGEYGELLAYEHLMMNYYEVLERNYRCHEGEIDIIAKKDNTIVFVEVKTRTTLIFGTPKEAVDKTKQLRITKASLRFLAEHSEYEGLSIRFDVIEIYLASKIFPRIEHIENAFEAADCDEY